MAYLIFGGLPDPQHAVNTEQMHSRTKITAAYLRRGSLYLSFFLYVRSFLQVTAALVFTSVMKIVPQRGFCFCPIHKVSKLLIVHI